MMHTVGVKIKGPSWSPKQGKTVPLEMINSTQLCGPLGLRRKVLAPGLFLCCWKTVRMSLPFPTAKQTQPITHGCSG